MTTSATAPPSTEATPVLDLYARIKEIEQADGSWPACDVVDLLCDWFVGYGIDIEADVAAAADTLALPAHLTAALMDRHQVRDELIVRIRTEHDEPSEASRTYVSALVWALGEGSRAVLFDGPQGEITRIGHPTASGAR